MSTVIAFMPMNLRLYDREERDLRTYVSPLFDCAQAPDNVRGVNAHIVADNGGGKSTLLLFFELLFCKPSRQHPRVGEKRVIDYLRRAAEDLHDPTPTTMAVLVRRDEAGLMRRARDTIFGYTVALRGDGSSLDLRRFVIPLAECPGFTLEQLARDYVYDANGAPLPSRVVRERLAGFSACHLYDSSEWDGYVQRMAEAGISSILWRELARMNAGEEAAESYFRTKDAFRNIVGLIQEAQQPTSGERAKALPEVASDVARQVSTQERDRKVRAASVRAAECVVDLSASVRGYAEARESMKAAEDEAGAAASTLRDVSAGLASELEAIRARSSTFQERRLLNEQLHLSERMRQFERKRDDCQAEVLAYKEDAEHKRELYRSAVTDVLLDDAARSWGRYRVLGEKIKNKQEQVKVLQGEFAVDEAVSHASERAWRRLGQAERSSQDALDQANESHDKAEDDLERTQHAYAQVDKEAHACDGELGGARVRLDIARKGLARVAENLEELDELQVTLEGFYTREALERVRRRAQTAERKAQAALDAAKQSLAETDAAEKAAHEALRAARENLIAKDARAQRWQVHLARTVERDERMRASATLWPEVTELAAVGDYGQATERVEALIQSADAEARGQEEAERAVQARIDALALGRLDMSEQLRSWLDRRELGARTLASHPGIPADDRDRVFEAYPWLAHALVVDDAQLGKLVAAARQDEIGEFGHAVFYVRQADVQRLLDATRVGNDLFASQGGTPIVGALRTVEQSYLEDPVGYEARMRQRVAEAHERAAKTREVSRLLGGVRNEIMGLSAHLEAIGMQGKTLADVSERAALAQKDLHDAEHARAAREDEWSNACAARNNAESLMEDAHQREREMRAQRTVIEELQRQNEECLEASHSYAEAEQASRRALRKKESAYREQEEARVRLGGAAEALASAQRERDAVRDLRERLAALGVQPESTVASDAACSSAELRAAVQSLENIVRERQRNISELQDELASLRDQQRQERVWRDILRDGGEDGITVSQAQIEAWQPRDEVGRFALNKRKKELAASYDEAGRRLQKADNELTLTQGRMDDCFRELERRGLSAPLEVPDDYDYHQTDWQIKQGEKDDQEAYGRLMGEKGQADEYSRRLDLVSVKLSRMDAYRATQRAESPDLAVLAACGPYVTHMEERAATCAAALGKADEALAKASDRARDAVADTGEFAVSRQMESSVTTVKSACGSMGAMLAVADRLSDHSQQFQTMAATLQNKLRATDEAIEDLVGRAVEEGYLLSAELHRLVIVSSARITGKRKQPTIRFRSRGHIVFQNEFHRDEVATTRLAHYVRRLVTEVLPPMDEIQRAEAAQKNLAPHELVYLLLDDRSVDVQYPVIRGGRGLSYEGARDTMGSGSTGQKSAGYVLSFLALLRYLSNTGALSAEGSSFVALENQFGKISSSKIIRDIKAVSDQMHMQLITVAGRELASAYEMGDVVYALYRTKGVQVDGKGSASIMRAKEDENGQSIADAIIDTYRATRRFENLSFDF